MEGVEQKRRRNCTAIAVPIYFNRGLAHTVYIPCRYLNLGLTVDYLLPVSILTVDVVT